MSKENNYIDLSKNELINLIKEKDQKINEINTENVKLKCKEFGGVIDDDIFKRIFHPMTDGVYIVNKEFDIQYVNPSLIKDFGVYEGKKCYKYFNDRENICPWCKNVEVFNGETIYWEWYSPITAKIYDLIETPIKNYNGNIFKLKIFHNITERKQKEEELQKKVKELNTLRNHLRSLSNHLQQIQENEKKGLARELHDELGQVLTAITLEVFNLRDNYSIALTNDVFNKANLIIKQILSLIDNTMKLTERIVMNLRPVILDDLGLIAALKWLVAQTNKYSKIECKFESIPDIDIDKDKAIAVYRIVQENITNIQRHSKATKMLVLIKEEDGKIHIIVSDNGIGFNEKKINKPGSFGILGMKERALLFGWNLFFENKKGKGAVVSLIIPFAST